MELDTVIDTKTDHDRKSTKHRHIELDSGKPHETHCSRQAYTDKEYREETVTGIGKQYAQDNDHQHHCTTNEHTHG